ncbi:SDR family NAD(P)-dependent oxidoreductase [Marinomonas ostreistagni]|uniref:SDR family oxidoreductase n=1 Tax=Marinomonas ostreistagni TaxID=359209 RepID=A0ABS0Z7G7_9GAMM|nr:SDR family NAD(P)-dependent oxidoreductase [Marinomonas ostreistagni]MBJ7549128.1 SDR family oxidoreductase [Marinomonas ostreistagni]
MRSFDQSQSQPNKQAVLITGATSGIGLALAQTLAEQGYVVIVNSRTEEDCLAIAQSIGGFALPFDVTDETALKVAFKTLNGYLRDNTLTLYGLAHCAGSMVTQPFHFTNATALQQMLNEHVAGAFLLSQWSSKLMMREQQGAITLLSSVVAQQGSVGQVAYASAKAAIEGMTKSLAKELGQYGIRVNAVAPGVIDTPLIAELSDEQRSAIQKSTVLKRLGQPQDIAQVLAFLLSDQSAFMTGQVLSVDGGLRLP